MDNSSNKNWVQRHPVFSGILGIVLASTIVSAFDDGDSDYQSGIKNNIQSSTTNSELAPLPELEIVTPTPYKAPQQNNCHPSYSGCLRADASDYDCAGGKGNGPYYTGSVSVYGPDVFDLDRDGDGVGCE